MRIPQLRTSNHAEHALIPGAQSASLVLIAERS
jgi:hypothetical protein